MPPTRAGPLGFGIYLGCVAATAGAALDYHLDLRPWKTVVHRVVPRSSNPDEQDDGFELRLRSRRRPPPIGCVDWPGGRVLLQWAIDEARLHEMPPEHQPAGGGGGGIHSSPNRIINAAASPTVVLEMGAGIGTASIGIAAAAKAASHPQSSSRDPPAEGFPLVVVATDVCDQTLANLEGNAALNGVAGVKASAWDACRGEASVRELPVPLHSIRHIIGSDVVYNGFETTEKGRIRASTKGKDNSDIDNKDSGRDDDDDDDENPQRPITDAAADDDDGGNNASSDKVPHSGLEVTLAALLRRRPDLPVTLLLEDRFSGGGVSALAGAAGVATAVQPVTTDPAITRFKHNCRLLGLRVEKVPVPAAVVRSVHDSQGWLTQLSWWLCGTWEGGLALYRVTLKDDPAAAAESDKSSR